LIGAALMAGKLQKHTTTSAQQGDSMVLKEGDFAPAFEAKTGQGETVQLSDFKGKTLVLYFYPKDDTPGCTAQACSFRDNLSEFKKRNAEVLGVSVDDVTSHAAFKKKYSLPFPLVPDPGGAIAKAYGVYNQEKGYALRYTFIIDPQGRIKKIFPNVKVDGHTPEVLAAL
jgi:peroxiredoxin Q/BCP